MLMRALLTHPGRIPKVDPQFCMEMVLSCSLWNPKVDLPFGSARGLGGLRRVSCSTLSSRPDRNFPDGLVNGLGDTRLQGRKDFTGQEHLRA